MLIIGDIMNEHKNRELQREIFELEQNIKVFIAFGGDATKDLKRLALCRAELRELMLTNYTAIQTIPK